MSEAQAATEYFRQHPEAAASAVGVSVQQQEPQGGAESASQRAVDVDQALPEAVRMCVLDKAPAFDKRRNVARLVREEC